MNPTALADAVLVAHFIYVSIVIFSVPLILVGRARKWGWVRNFWFRIIHLFMILIVAQIFLGGALPINCMGKLSAQKCWPDCLSRPRLHRHMAWASDVLSLPALGIYGPLLCIRTPSP